MTQKFLADDPLLISVGDQEKNPFYDKPKTNIEGIFNKYVIEWGKADMADKVRWLHGRELSNRQIAWELRINLRTVRRLLKKW